MNEYLDDITIELNILVNFILNLSFKELFVALLNEFTGRTDFNTLVSTDIAFGASSSVL